MPSPTSTTVPTLRVSAVSSNPSIADLMMLMISSDRMAIASPFGPWPALPGLARVRLAAARQELVAEPLEAAPDTGVDEPIADADGEPAEQLGVDPPAQLDAGAGHRL